MTPADKQSLKYLFFLINWILQQLILMGLGITGFFIGTYDIIHWAINTMNTSADNPISFMPMIKGDLALLVGWFAMMLFAYRGAKRRKEREENEKNGTGNNPG